MVFEGTAGSCPLCGADDVGGREGCEVLFQEVVGREFSDPARFQVHMMTVDAYSLQHPEGYMKSLKSHAAHLTSMCWAQEFDAPPLVGKRVSAWLEGGPELVRAPVPPPGARGALTVADVHATGDAREHVEVVRR
ncbi:MAG: hypothetical protein D6701_15500, partial [Gemmatimonadetes bacterium]